jgi:two-component system response regulator PilR (NtrC family)
LNESILVVDDDAGVREMLSSILSDEGYMVETAENGKQAVKFVEKMSFDLALVDIKLPDMKGTELLQMLKQRRPKMVKIIITGYPSLENAIGAVNEGAEGYVLKPFNVPKLLETIKRHMDEKAGEEFRVWTEKQERERKDASFQEQFKKQKGSVFSH